MYAVINRLEIQTEHADKVDGLFERNAALLKECTGFLSMTLLRPEANPATRQIYVLWESADAYEGFKKSEVFRKTHAGVDPSWFKGPPMVEKMDVAFSIAR